MAVKEVTDTATGEKEFTNLNTLIHVWADFQTNGEKLQFGHLSVVLQKIWVHRIR
jgi:hypothetical protein